MAKQVARPRLNAVLRWLLPLGISALAVALLLRSIDLDTLMLAFRSITVGTLLIAVALFIIGLLFRVWAWHLMLGEQFPFARVFYVMNAGYLLNNVFPFRLGEFGRAILLGSHEPGKPGILAVLSSIVVERIFDVFLAAVFFLSTLPLVLVEGNASWIAFTMLGLAVFAFLMLIVITRKREIVIGWLGSRQGKLGKPLAWLAPKVDGLLKGFSVLNNPRLFVLSFLFLLISWVLSMVQHTFLRLELMPGSEWWWVIFVLSTGAFAGALPSAPAGLGVFEAANVGAFILLGVDQSTALAYALIVHAIQFTFLSLFGLVGLIKEGQSIGDLYRKARLTKRAKQEISE